jgi:hypothetical protein
VFPDFTILLFFILPVKVKWLAWFSAAGLALTFLGAPGSIRIAILAALANYLSYFLPSLRSHRAPPAAIGSPRTGPVHRCTACGRTERDGSDLEFRWCACIRCRPDGREYCREHLEAHRADSAA